MEKEKIRRAIYSKIEDLPTLPAALPKILSLVESDRSSAADIAAVIERDPALAAKILKVSNSAYYGFSREITVIETAVGLLGLNMVRSLALSIGVMQSLPAGRQRTNFSQAGLWKHSLAVATIIQELRSRAGRWEDGDHLFIVGLLHDLGKVVLDQFYGDLFGQALDEVNNQGAALLHIEERKRIGMDHGEIGAMLLARWQFPEVISRAIAGHHAMGQPSGPEAGDVAMLRLADTLAYQLGLSEAGNPAPPEIGGPELKILKMNNSDLVELREKFKDVEESVSAFYSAMF